MPKIRLSALATDIKGKSGGSVFSTNAGGTYFRNNPSGTGSKKPGTSVRKQLFASLSQSWRNLSNAQQVAWSDAGVLYPTTNAWGETRIPKGFELFMRLNGNLQAAGETLLLVPVAPRAIPALGSPAFTYSDLFQLIGQRGFLPNSPNIAEIDSYGVIEDFKEDMPVSTDDTDSFRFSLNQSDSESFAYPASIELFNILSSPTYYQKFSLILTGGGLYQLVSKFTNGSFEILNITNPISKEQLKDIHFCIFTNLDESNEVVFFVNGIQITSTQSVSGTPVSQTDVFSSLYLGKTANINALCIFQDFRTFSGNISDSDVSLVSKGYILGTEANLFPLSVFDNYNFENFCSRGREMIVITNSEIQPPQSVYIHEFTPELVPDIVVTAELNTEVGYKLQILTSEFVSPGKNVISATKKTIGYFSFLDVEEIDIYRGLKSLLKFTVGGTTLFIQARYLDITSGAVGVASDVLPVGKPKPRFKAGAELSGKVN
jgi:hypothetical protein